MRFLWVGALWCLNLCLSHNLVQKTLHPEALNVIAMVLRGVLDLRGPQKAYKTVVCPHYSQTFECLKLLTRFMGVEFLLYAVQLPICRRQSGCTF